MNLEGRVIYIPPASAIFDKLAREACHILAQQGNSGFDDPEVMYGFAAYLKLVAELTAKYLNKGHYELLDKYKT
jgi:hypothetical protein